MEHQEIVYLWLLHGSKHGRQERILADDEVASPALRRKRMGDSKLQTETRYPVKRMAGNFPSI